MAGIFGRVFCLKGVGGEIGKPILLILFNFIIDFLKMMVNIPTEFSNVYFQCPKCGEKGKASQRKYLGGINDRGGVLLRCKKCKCEFFLPLLNPSEAWISPNFEIVKFLDFEEDIEESKKYQWAKDIVPIVNEEDFSLSKNAWNLKVSYPWDLSENEKINIYKCKICNQSLEPPILEKVKKESLEFLNVSYQKYFTLWVKGRRKTPQFIIETDAISCKCGKKYAYYIGAEFNGRGEKISLEESFLIGILGVEPDIRGIYSRKEANLLLRKIIYRWYVIASEIIVVSPFIGFSLEIEKRRKKDFFEFIFHIVSLLKNPKIRIYTRPSEWKKIKEIIGKDIIDSLEKYDLLHPVLENIKNSSSIKDETSSSHAKFYAGIVPTKHGCEVEILEGSLNLHPDSPTKENLSFHRIPFVQFKQRYLEPLGIKEVGECKKLNHIVLKDMQLIEVNAIEDLFDIKKDISF